MKNFSDLLAQTDFPFKTLTPGFWERVKPQPLKKSQLLDLNPLGTQLLQLPADCGQEEQWRALHNGELTMAHGDPICAYYAGHQFGSWAGRLGDGRAHTIGTINGYELQLKGAGLTPFSRMGDGRAVLRSTIREYLASEYLAALQIPTTRSLGILTSKDPVYREDVETAATMIRLSPSFVRFGTFEYFCWMKQTAQIGQLLEFLQHYYFNEVNSHEELFAHVIQQTATLMAQWMAYGFCHGVMNTDNMSILGLTLDYGPYGFLENYDPDHICNHSDHTGRYRFSEQPGIAAWNLYALAHALQDFIPLERSNQLVDELFWKTYTAAYQTLMTQRFGLPIQKESSALINTILKQITKKADLNQLLYTLTSNQATFPEVIADQADPYWKLRTDASATQMSRLNPKFVLRNWVCQHVIEQVKAGNHAILGQVRHVMQHPFEEHSEFDFLAQATPDWGRCLEVSCSS